ncbi:MAG: hypothetical protein WAV40_00950, partial [Microgenomates group bacterium]
MSKKTWAINKTFTAIIWIIAIAIRLYGATTKAQIYDIGTFEAWSRTFWNHGPSNFFNVVWSDYLPLPILSFAPISLLADFLHAPFGLIFKLVHIALELFLISLLPSSAFIAKLLLLLSPALIGDNSFWGQVDVIPALLSVVAVTSNSAVLFGLAVAYKPIMVLIAPLLWINSIKKGDKWYRFPLISMVIFFATGIPTGGLHFATHLFTRIFDQAGT